jgi:hypothetical protein
MSSTVRADAAALGHLGLSSSLPGGGAGVGADPAHRRRTDVDAVVSFRLPGRPKTHNGIHIRISDHPGQLNRLPRIYRLLQKVILSDLATSNGYQRRPSGPAILINSALSSQSWLDYDNKAELITQTPSDP